MPSEEPSQPISVDTILHQLDVALSEERRALRALDRDGVEQAAGRKLELAELLSLAMADAPVDPSKLQRLRSKIVHNQLLLVHARDSVRGILRVMTGAPGPSYGPGGARHIGSSAGLDTTG